MRFFQPKQYISLDYGRQEVVVFSVGDGEAQGLPSANPQIKMFKPEVTAEEPLHAEIKSFLDAVRTRSRPVVSLEEGRSALQAALEVAAAIRYHGEKVDLESLAVNRLPENA
jgi:predicted dehydrogenase